MATSDQCAVAVDGSLLDANDIIFYNNPDDETPLPQPDTNSAPPSTQIHPLFQGDPAPSVPTASRCSTRIARPSTHITDPNNMEAQGSAATRKRSATTTIPAEGPLHSAHQCHGRTYFILFFCILYGFI